jgi:hypothetical protein
MEKKREKKRGKNTSESLTIVEHFSKPLARKGSTKQGA